MLEIHNNNFPFANYYIDAARDILDTDLTAMVGESYQRAYGSMVTGKRPLIGPLVEGNGVNDGLCPADYNSSRVGVGWRIFVPVFVHDIIYSVVNYSSSSVDVVCMYVCVCPSFMDFHDGITFECI